MLLISISNCFFCTDHERPQPKASSPQEIVDLRRESSIVGGFHLGRPVPLLVNAPDLSRNLLRAAMPRETVVHDGRT